MTAPTAAPVVVVPVLLPLNVYHRPDPGDPGHTRCGRPLHGWYPMTELEARDLADRPCPDGCFTTVARVAVIPRQRQGRS